MGSVRPRSAVAFARSRRRRKVSSPRSFFRGDGPRGFFVGDPSAASASATPPSILAPRAGFRRVGLDPKLFETFGPLGALLPGFFSADVALANAPAAPSSPSFVRRDGLMREGVVGAMMILLDLACFTEASGRKSEVPGSTFSWFLETSTSDTQLKLVG
jgi:hypothetical protein